MKVVAFRPQLNMTLAEDLLRTSPEDRVDLLSTTRYRSLGTAELILQRSHALQLADPVRAMDLAHAAGGIAEALLPASPLLASPVLGRAALLRGNAARLAGQITEAHDSLSSAVPFLEDPQDRALYCRSLALLRWHQGFLDEAMALLQRASCLYNDLRQPGDLLACQQLVGLIYMELGDYPSAAVTLKNPPLDPTVRPWLSARAFFSLAYSIAASNRGHRSSPAYDALCEGESLLSLMRDETELLTLVALEARAQGRLGHREAGQSLEQVRSKFREMGNVIDLALCSLQLLAFRVSNDHPPRIDELVQEFRATPESVVSQLVLEAFDRLPTVMAEDPWDAANFCGSWLLQALRLRNFPLRPLPFA